MSSSARCVIAGVRKAVANNPARCLRSMTPWCNRWKDPPVPSTDRPQN